MLYYVYFLNICNCHFCIRNEVQL